MPRWCSADDKKLAHLFRSGKVNSKRVDSKSIRKVLETYFAERKYDSFAPLFRDKARKWNLAKTLEGDRKSKGIAASTADVNSEEAGEVAEAQDLAPAVDDDEAEDNISVESPQAEAGAEEEEEVVAELTESFSRMTTTGFTNFGMSFTCPFILYDYIDRGRQVVSVDYLIPCVHKRFVRLNIRDDGMFLDLSIVVPHKFYDPKRLNEANEEETDFNKNTHKATAFFAASQKIMESCSNDVGEIIFGKQTVRLPFKCETDFYKGEVETDEDGGWEVQAFETDDETMIDEYDEEGDPPPEHFILSVDLVSVKKPKQKRSRGNMRRVNRGRRTSRESREDDMNMNINIPA